MGKFVCQNSQNIQINFQDIVFLTFIFIFHENLQMSQSNMSLEGKFYIWVFYNYSSYETHQNVNF